MKIWVSFKRANGSAGVSCMDLCPRTRHLFLKLSQVLDRRCEPPTMKRRRMTRTRFLLSVLIGIALTQWCALSTTAQSPANVKAPAKHAASQQELDEYRAAAA